MTIEAGSLEAFHLTAFPLDQLLPSESKETARGNGYTDLREGSIISSV